MNDEEVFKRRIGSLLVLLIMLTAWMMLSAHRLQVENERLETLVSRLQRQRVGVVVEWEIQAERYREMIPEYVALSKWKQDCILSGCPRANAEIVRSYIRSPSPGENE